jgi:hypothetical protein
LFVLSLKEFNVLVILEIIFCTPSWVLKSDFDLVYGIVYDNIVVQLTEDQHMCEPRLLFFDGSDNPDTMTSTIIHMTKVATLHPELYLKFKDFRLKIEVNLQEQIIL